MNLSDAVEPETRIRNISESEPFDTSEFGIPDIENPTLESILNEPEDDFDIHLDGAEGGNVKPFGAVTDDDATSINAETESVASQDIRFDYLRLRAASRQLKNIRYQRHGSVVRQVLLKSISAQVVSANDRVDAGLPTALAVSSLIAVGTSHGLILVFDSQQLLKWMLGSVAVGKQYGAVSALTFNCDTDRLLVGFARGQMTMWNLLDGKLLRTITDAHPPGSAILNVKFTDDHTLALCSDSGGSVYQLEMKRSMTGRSCDSRCIFSGARGEVCCLEPLHLQSAQKNHPLKDVILVAMATLSKVLVITLKPAQKLMFVFPLKSDPSTLPLLAWQYVVIQVSETERVLDPVLAFARNQTIYFYQVIATSSDDIRFAQLQKTEVAYKLLSISWFNSRTLIAIDVTERAHVIDVRTEEELEVVEVTQAELVYQNSFYKSLATGGNVSEALAFAGERSCYQSNFTYNGQLILLGRKGVHVLSLRPWKDRIDILARQKKFSDALKLAASFHQGQAKAVVGLPRKASEKRELVKRKMVQLLCEFVDYVLAVGGSPTHSSTEAHRLHFQQSVPIIVEHCLKLNKHDLLFGELFDSLSSNPAAVGVMLESLEPYILTDRLNYVTPVIMQQFVEHYKSCGLLHDVEQCIVHMDVASLDIHQVFVLCWEHALYDAIIHVYNKGMKDYTTPINELMVILSKAVMSKKPLTSEDVNLGNKILVYISCCLSGRAYPVGDLEDDIVDKVKDDVFTCLTCLHTKVHPDDELSYPYLRTLLHFDSREFFNVLAMSFEELGDSGGLNRVDRKQRLVDILLYVMVENNIDFVAHQVGTLFTFLARQMAKPDSTIMVSRALFEQVLDALCIPCDVIDSRHEERQQALLELITAGGLKHIDEERLIAAAEVAKFFQVCEKLYMERRAFDKMLSCYWGDPIRKPQAFSYIQHILMRNDVTSDEKQKVQVEAMNNLAELVEINKRKAAQLVCIGFGYGVGDVTGMLEHSDELLFKFLSAIFEINEKTGSPLYIDRQLHAVESVTHERYIDMMCQRDPTRVHQYLRFAENFRLQETIDIVKSHRITDATAYLLEQNDDVQGAYEVLFAELKAVCKDASQHFDSRNDGDAGATRVAASPVQHCLEPIIALCQRHGGKITEEQRQSLWFPVLDTVMTLERQAQRRGNDDFKALTSLVLNSMMTQISLPAILTKVMQDPVYSGGTFGDVKELMIGMLETYNYEKTLLNTVKNLVNHDLHQQVATLTQTVKRAIVPQSDVCCICEQLLYDEDPKFSLICFRCGHSYHRSCLKSRLPPRDINNEETWMCALCSGKSRTVVAQSTRMQRSSSCLDASSSSDPTLGQTKPYQVQSLEKLRRCQKTQSRLMLLTELSKQRNGTTSSSTFAKDSIFENDDFQLRVTVPRIDFDNV